MKLPEQLRLVADILEKNLPWEACMSGELEAAFSSHPEIMGPLDAVINGYEVKIMEPQQA